ncbi:MAG: hypothetical protein NTY98_10820 [Verrucomicrobia bacterium]|nr:hypothetical protein [Verrucomicrobiota bacterium]
MPVEVHNFPVFILCLVCLGVYGVVVPRLFKPGVPVKPTRTKRLFIYLFWGMLVRGLWHAFLYQSSPVCQIVGIALGCCSLVLFSLAYRQHGTQMPGRAFTPDVPAVLVTSGPYSRLRHPVYTAYLLIFLGMTVGTQDGVMALGWLCLLMSYYIAARLEEQLLGNSLHSSTFRLYQQQSGLLLPWNFWRPRTV